MVREELLRTATQGQYLFSELHKFGNSTDLMGFPQKFADFLPLLTKVESAAVDARFSRPRRFLVS